MSIGAPIATLDLTGTLASPTSLSLSGLTIKEDDVLVLQLVDVRTGTRGITSATGDNSGAWAEQVDTFADDTNDANLAVYVSPPQKATVDTSISVVIGGGVGTRYAARILQFRGVDTVTQIDVATPAPTTGTNGNLANPPSITPSTVGARIVALYAGTMNTTGAAAWGAPANIENFSQNANTSAAPCPRLASGGKDWVSGAFDPDAVTAGGSTISDSWVGATIALRPAKDPIRKGAIVSTGSTSASALTIDVSSLGLVAGDTLLVGACLVQGIDRSATCSGNLSGSFTVDANLFSNDTRPTNAFAFRKKLTAADTSVTITIDAGNHDIAYAIVAYSGADANLDVAVATATGINTDLADPPSVTPTTANAKIIPFYFGAQNTSTAWGVPTDVTNFQQAGIGGARAAVANKNWVSGAFNAAALASGDNNAFDSWASVVYVLKPQTSFLLVMQDASSASQTTSPVLAPKTTLTVANANSATLADNVVLSSNYVLSIAAALSATLADNVVVSTGLPVNSAVSATLADNVVLSPKTVLTVSNAVSSTLTDNVALVPKTALSVADMNSATQTTSPTLANLKYTLVVQAAVSVTVADNPTLTPKWALVPNAAVSATILEAVTITPRHVLTVAGATSLTFADNVTVGIPLPTPEGRKVYYTKQSNTVAFSKIQDGEIVYFSSSGANGRTVFF